MIPALRAARTNSRRLWYLLKSKPPTRYAPLTERSRDFSVKFEVGNRYPMHKEGGPGRKDGLFTT